MSTPYDPMKKPMKKALLIAVKNVRGEQGSRFDNLPSLSLAHRDAEDFRDKLISSYEYRPDNVVLMKDDKSHPKRLWPTRKRILSQMQRLTKDAPEHCHITLYFSGHCLEEECPDPERARMRADGRDSEIVCADGKPILDYELHEYLVEPLEHVKGSKLFTLFDCCHSETLLNLQNGRSPNAYSRVWNIGRGQLLKGIAIAIVNILRLEKKYCKCRRTPQPVRRASTMLISPSTSNTLEVGELNVICLSACRDQQLALDDCEIGDTFTKYFIDAASKTGITWEGLRDELRNHISDILVRYEETRAASLTGFENRGHWTQDPRLITNHRMDLRQTISL